MTNSFNNNWNTCPFYDNNNNPHVTSLEIMMWVLLIMLCTSLGNPHYCLKFFITLLILAFVGHAITFLKRTFRIATNSYNTFEIVDLLIAKSSLHIKRLVPWASLYIAHNTHISIGKTLRYWVSCFISTCHNWLTI